jgi:hypothetical protein
MNQAPTKDGLSLVLFLMLDKSYPCRSYDQGGFCFLSVSYFVRILSKFQAVRGFRGKSSSK